MARPVASKWPKTESVTNYDTFRKRHFKGSERNAATPAEERSDETPQELATRRLSASSAESVRMERRVLYTENDTIGRITAE